MLRSAIVIDAADNVATALADLPSAFRFAWDGGTVDLAETVAFGHKFALVAIPAGSRIVKYGETIGTACRAITAGEHVHVHNLLGGRGRRTES